MKVKQYISKYGLDMASNFDHSSFIFDLSSDFISQIEYQMSVGQFQLAHFENLVKQIKQKFDSISYKSKVSIDKWEKLWKYFYATVVVKLRDEHFGDYLKKIKEEKERKRKENYEYNAFKSQFDDIFFSRFNFINMFFKTFASSNHEFFNFVFGQTTSNQVPSKEFAELGIPENSSIEDIQAAFRKLALEHHPDKGGNAAKFQSILEAKNKCLMYAERNIYNKSN